MDFILQPAQPLSDGAESPKEAEGRTCAVRPQIKHFAHDNTSDLIHIVLYGPVQGPKVTQLKFQRAVLVRCSAAKGSRWEQSEVS